METKKVRIGFVGVGDMGQCAHLKNYVTIPDCEVVAIAELRKDLAQKVAARYGISKIYSNHNDLLANEKLDGIVASQWFTRHGSILPELLKAGVPIFIEKPLAGSIQVGEKIVQAVKESGTFVMVGYHKRSDPATIHAKQEIDRLKQSGELGKLTYVRIIMPAGDWTANGYLDLIRGEQTKFTSPADPPAPDMDEKLYKEFTDLVNYYIHQLNLMRHLLGEPYSVKYADPSGILLVGESTSGIPCVIEMSPYETTIDWQESAFVSFKKGWIKLNLPAPLASNRPGQVEIFKDPGNGAVPQTIIPQFPWIHAMRQQALNFVAAIKGEINPPCEAAEALDDLKIAREYMRLLRGA